MALGKKLSMTQYYLIPWGIMAHKRDNRKLIKVFSHKQLLDVLDYSRWFYEGQTLEQGSFCKICRNNLKVSKTNP